MWRYYKDNIGTDRPVAEFFNKNNVRVLVIMEDRYSYYSVPCSSIIKSHSVKYSDTVRENDSVSKHDSSEILLERLKIACNEIQEDYNRQLLNIFENVFNLI